MFVFHYLAVAGKAARLIARLDSEMEHAVHR